MRERSKYAREFYNKVLDIIGKDTKTKREILEFKAENLPYEEYREYLAGIICNSSIMGRFSFNYKEKIAEFMMAAVEVTHHFNQGLHFYLSEVPNVVACNKDVLFELLDNEEPVYIDFPYKDYSCFAVVVKRKSEYSIVLYMDDPNATNKYERYVRVYTCYINKENNNISCAYNDAFAWTKQYVTQEDNESVTFSEAIPEPNFLLQIATHVLYCYKYRDTLQRTNGKARRVYRQAKVHVASKTSRTGDTYVPLVAYASSKSEYKGGHHRSPVPHSRRGFYRRSRGRGNYELINNKFVYVGEMRGHYSYVTATSVNAEKKKERVRVYTL